MNEQVTITLGLDGILVAFGNYLLSAQREESTADAIDNTKVTHADLENFKILSGGQ